MFLFCSPQFFIHHPDFCGMIMDAAAEHVLILLLVDEVHLYVQQGISFWHEICQLRDCFWKRMFHPRKVGNFPKVVFATGIMAQKYILMLKEITTTPLPVETIQWGAREDFSQRKIAMEFKNSKDHLFVLSLGWPRDLCTYFQKCS